MSPRIQLERGSPAVFGERMKVALVGPRPPPSGGIAVHVESLGAALRELGHEVEVLDISRTTAPLVVARKLASLAARGYLLHLHTNGHNEGSWSLATAAGLSRTPRRANLITLHSGLLPGYLEGVQARQAAARFALAPYGRIVAVSRPIVEALAAANVPRAKIVELPAFLPDAVRPGELPEAALAARERHSVLLSAALAPSPIYGARVLWAALAQLARIEPGIGLVVFGPETDALRVELATAGLQDRVYGLGELGHSEALAAMAVSDLFVRPTLADGDAISVREALTLGVRAVASDVAARPTGTTMFRAGDPFALAEAIREALKRPAMATSPFDPLPQLLELYRDMSRPTPRRVRGFERRRQLGFAPGF